MIGKVVEEQPDPLDEQIKAVLHEMTIYGPDSPEYPMFLTSLERLNALKAQKPDRSVSPDTMATIAGNLLGILIIVAYEQNHVLTSKAFGFGIKKNP